jgi:hypothetical protein
LPAFVLGGFVNLDDSAQHNYVPRHTFTKTGSIKIFDPDSNQIFGVGSKSVNNQKRVFH